MLEITPLPAFKDNYIWMLARNGHAVVVDPGDATPVQHAMDAHGLKLAAILVTHHHADHTGGVERLQEAHAARVYAPRAGSYRFHHQPVSEGDRVTLQEIGLTLHVMETPGHTLDHVSYHGDDLLFCGDTLFCGGCGRVFEGSCEQLYASLQRLAELPETTRVYCTHEYTLSNLAFAHSVDPGNPALQQLQADVERQRAAGLPTLPSNLARELAINPFLRCGSMAMQQLAARHGLPPAAPAERVFCLLRELKNSF